MTLEEAEEMARRAKPCPFCGRNLLSIQVEGSSQDDWRLYHPESDCINPILNKDDLDLWNTRAPIEVTDEIVRKAVRDYHSHLYDHRNDLDGAMRAALEAALNGGVE